MISSSVVVFPQPDSPTRPRVSPSRTSRSTSETAYTHPTRRFEQRAPQQRVGPADAFQLEHGRAQVPAHRRARRLRQRRDGVDGGAVDPAVRDPVRPDARHLVPRATPARAAVPLGAGVTAIGHRGANGQPGGRSTSSGGCPAIGTRGARAALSTRGTAPSRPIVYGIRGRANSSSTAAFSTGRPAYMTSTSSAVPATTPRSWVMRTSAAPVSARASASTSRIWAWTVTSSAVVGSSAMITFGSFAIAIAMTTRCRIPPENSCGNDRARSAAFGIPTRSSSSTARFRATSRSSSWWIRSASTIWLPHREDRGQRRRRVLKDHRQVAAADPRQLPVVEADQFPARPG